MISSRVPAVVVVSLRSISRLSNVQGVTTVQYKNRNPRYDSDFTITSVILNSSALHPNGKGGNSNVHESTFITRHNFTLLGLLFIIHTRQLFLLPQGSIVSKSGCTAYNIGRILAYRCQQCGLQNVFFDEEEYPLTNESTKAFHDALLEFGIELHEPDYRTPIEPLGIDYDSLREEEKRQLYPSLMENLRTIPDWNSIPYPYSLRPRAGRAKLHNRYQILSKVRKGMVWDPFYHRMVLEKDKAYWQHEMEERLRRQLDGSTDKLSDGEKVPLVVPKKWRLT